MTQLAYSIRRAERADAGAIAAVHDAAWREAYRGVIPGRALERMITRRGDAWWLRAVSRGTRLIVLDAGEGVAGYASIGRNRVPALPFGGEVYELYLNPEHQGLGFGRRLFRAALRELAERGHERAIVWVLADNARGCAFYESLGGTLVARGEEQFDGTALERLAYGFRTAT